ncbi:MAG: hypothetical protein AB1467_05010 [Candidatus Diapherotrites archaeon]
MHSRRTPKAVLERQRQLRRKALDYFKLPPEERIKQRRGTPVKEWWQQEGKEFLGTPLFSTKKTIEAFRELGGSITKGTAVKFLKSEGFGEKRFRKITAIQLKKKLNEFNLRREFIPLKFFERRKIPTVKIYSEKQKELFEQIKASRINLGTVRKLIKEKRIPFIEKQVKGKKMILLPMQTAEFLIEWKKDVLTPTQFSTEAAKQGIKIWPDAALKKISDSGLLEETLYLTPGISRGNAQALITSMKSGKTFRIETPKEYFERKEIYNTINLLGLKMDTAYKRARMYDRAGVKFIPVDLIMTEEGIKKDIERKLKLKK